MLTDFHLLSGMSLAHRNKLHQLDGTLRAAILNASVESKETYKNQLGTIDSLACQQVLNNSAIARTAPPSETTLSQIKYGLEDSQAGTAFSQATTRQCVKEWSNGVEKVRNMSEAQAGTLKAAIELRQDLCPTESSRNLQGSKIHEPSKASADGENDRAQDKLPTEETEEELRTSLERLCSLAAGKERTVFSREAQDIMDNIEHLLNVVSSMMEIRNQKGSEKKRKRQETHCRDHDEPGDEDSQCKRGVKRMKGLLATSQCIAVNSNGTYQSDY